MYKIFANREKFNYSIPTFDKLIQTPGMPASFVLYQEMAMAALNFAGIPMTECYGIVKYISKKRIDKVKSYRDMFLIGFANEIMKTEKKTQEESEKTAEMVWQIISDSSRYLFNASHSYCVSVDSLYGAYLKSHYPLEFYETFLRIMDEKGNKDRMKAAQQEAEKAFKIKFEEFKFRQDNRNIVGNKKTNTMTYTLKSIKKFGANIGEQLYPLKDNKYKTFIDLLIDMEEKSILCVKIESLIKIQYFEEFGKNQKLLTLYDEFQNGTFRYDRKHKDKTKEKRIIELKRIEEETLNENVPLKDQLDFENKILGYINCTYPINKRYVYISGVDTKYAPRVDCYCLNNGKYETMKIQKRLFNNNLLEEGDVIYMEHCEKKNRMVKTENGFDTIEDEFVWWIRDYRKVDIDKIIKDSIKA